jgi:hypothetical protein
MGKERSTTDEKQRAAEAKGDSDSEGESSIGTKNVMADTIDDVEMMKTSTAIALVPRSSTAAELPRNGNIFSSNCTKVYDLDSEEEKQEETVITNSDNFDARTGRDRRARRPRESDSEEEEEEEEAEDPTPGAFAFSNEQGNFVRRVKGRITASMVEEGQTSSLSLMENEGPTSPSVLSEPRGPVAIDEQSLILGELAEPSQEDEELRQQFQELRRQNQELERIVGEEVVQGTAIVDHSGGGDHDQNAASSPFELKERRFLIGATFALLLVVGVILGVTIPSIDSTVTPTQSPALTEALTEAPTKAPTKAPTEAPTAAPTAAPTQSPAPTACTNSMDCLAELLLQKIVSDAEALQDDSSPQFRALRWLANNDTMLLDLDSAPSVILAVERYVLAVLYFATSGEGWEDQRRFLSASSVCEWNSGGKGARCNEDDLVVALNLCK